MRKFRRCDLEHVMSKIAWTEAPPSRAVTEWKEHFVEIFMARGLDYAARRDLLPGDWRLSERIDFCLVAHLERFKEGRLLKLICPTPSFGGETDLVQTFFGGSIDLPAQR